MLACLGLVVANLAMLLGGGLPVGHRIRDAAAGSIADDRDEGSPKSVTGRVERVGTESDGRLPVSVRPYAQMYFLHPSEPGFEDLLRLLKEAHSSQRVVRCTFRRYSGRIVAVEWADLEKVRGDAASAVPAAEEKEQPELVVFARLTHGGNPSPHCGDSHLAVVMKYQILDVLSGRHEGSPLYVVHGCPELPRRDYEAGAGDVVTFEVGDAHKLSLTTRGPFLNGEANDAFSSERGRRYWALRTDTATGR